METIEKKEFSISKGVAEVYQIRHPSGMYWADITIQSGETDGRVSIASDWGDWQRYWNACGTGGFKKFLIGLGMDYAAGKFGASKCFDFEETIIRYKKHVLESRREMAIGEDKARQIWAEIDNLESSGEDEYQCNMMHYCSGIMELYDHSPERVEVIKPQFRNFWNETWKVFIEQLKLEIA